MMKEVLKIKIIELLSELWKRRCVEMSDNIEVIGIDHGWMMMKTASQVFKASAEEISTEPAFFDNILEYKADSPEGIHSTMIDNSLAAKLGMTEDELFKCAVQNTKRIFPPVVKNMNDVIREMCVKDGMPLEVAEMMTQEIPDDKSMWVISNAQGINGAVSMLYEDNLHELAAMVVEVNMQEVELAERLSNQVYHYDKELRKLDLATDTPNKRLDGIVAEQSLVYSSQEKSR